MLNRTGLVPPYSGNAGDGNASEPELTTAEEIREQIEAPVRNAHAGARKDAIGYLVHNAMSGADAHIDVRQAINVRWNLRWTEVDAIIHEAQEPAKREIERAKAERVRAEQERIRFENLSALFTDLGLQIQISGDRFNLLGLTESQLRLCADMLAA